MKRRHRRELRRLRELVEHEQGRLGELLVAVDRVLDAGPGDELLDALLELRRARGIRFEVYLETWPVPATSVGLYARDGNRLRDELG